MPLSTYDARSTGPVLNEVLRKINQKRAAGQIISPSTETALIEASLNDASANANRDRALNESIRQFDVSQASRASEFGQTMEQRNKEMKAAQKGQTLQGIGSLAGSLGTTYTLGKAAGLWGTGAPAAAKTVAPVVMDSIAPGVGAPAALDAGMLPVETSLSTMTPAAYEVGQGALTGPITYGTEMGGAGLVGVGAGLSGAGTATGMSTAGAGAIEAQMAAQGAYGAGGAGAGTAGAGSLGIVAAPIALGLLANSIVSAQKAKSLQYSNQSYADNFNYVKSIRPNWSDSDIHAFVTSRGGNPQGDVADLSGGVPSEPLNLAEILAQRPDGNYNLSGLSQYMNDPTHYDPGYKAFSDKYLPAINALEMTDEQKYGSAYTSYPEAWAGPPGPDPASQFNFPKIIEDIKNDPYNNENAKMAYLNRLESLFNLPSNAMVGNPYHGGIV